MAELRAQEIFSSGTWNGLTFTDADLDGMVKAFDGLGLAGKVPLKFGHDSAKPVKDGKPALGWVQRLYREGRRLLADFSNVPDAVMTAIREKLYKHVSVELLQNVKAGTREIPWVPDAVALLGADQPAVGILKELEALTMSARTVLRFDARVAFTRDFQGSNQNLGDDTTMSDESLRNELQLAVKEYFENQIVAGRILPRTRELFFKRHTGDQVTMSAARSWVAGEPAVPAHQRGRTLGARSAFDGDEGGGFDEGMSNSQRFTALAQRVMKEKGYTMRDLDDANKHVDFLRAMQARDPTLWHAHAVEPWNS